MNKIINKIENESFEKIEKKIIERIYSKQKTVVITLNSEHIHSKTPVLEKLYMDPNTLIVADGISTQFATWFRTKKRICKVPGVNLVANLLNYASENNLSVGVLGSTEKSIKLFEKTAKKKYPGISKLICTHGYVENPSAVMEKYATNDLDLILVAFGVPKQEELIRENLDKFDYGVFIGVGGSIDVIGGLKKRAPNFFIKTNTEWLYRIVREPSRISKFVKSNTSFIIKVLFDKE